MALRHGEEERTNRSQLGSRLSSSSLYTVAVLPIVVDTRPRGYPQSSAPNATQLSQCVDHQVLLHKPSLLLLVTEPFPGFLPGVGVPPPHLILFIGAVRLPEQLPSLQHARWRSRLCAKERYQARIAPVPEQAQQVVAPEPWKHPNGVKHQDGRRRVWADELRRTTAQIRAVHARRALSPVPMTASQRSMVYGLAR